MGVGIPSHIGFNPCSHYVTHVGHIIVGGGIYNAKRQIEYSHTQNVFYCKGRTITKARVCYPLHNKGENYLADGGKGGTE